jgi:hypothetical protein
MFSILNKLFCRPITIDDKTITKVLVKKGLYIEILG